jgi:hypothetical protein
MNADSKHCEIIAFHVSAQPPAFLLYQLNVITYSLQSGIVESWVDTRASHLYSIYLAL